MTQVDQPLLSIKELSVSFTQGTETVNALHSFSANLYRGKTLALVGESGSGKSVCAHSLLKLLPYPQAFHPSGKVIFNDADLLSCSENTLRKIRGQSIAMIFQEPMTALNPLKTVSDQIDEGIRDLLDKKARRARVRELLTQVHIQHIDNIIDAYPHQLSGGQRQRVMIAMAIANKPEVLIADEPTTALDVHVQQEILQLLKSIQQQSGLAILLISHDLGMVRQFADEVCVMQHGNCVERGDVDAIFKGPQHSYTQLLLAPQASHCQALQGDEKPLLSAKQLSVKYPLASNTVFRKQFFHAASDINFTLYERHSLGIVGESGSGKSSVANALLKLIDFSGDLQFENSEISALSQKQFRPYRQHIQVVFQDPFASLSPRLNIAQIIGEGLRYIKKEDKQSIEQQVIETMQLVGLNPDDRFRYPHEFSGGQRQRIAIARAVIIRPRCIILDEPTSALDRNVQFQVLDLLADLQQKLGMSYLFISHDLGLIKAFCHDVIVMQQGKIIEAGSSADVFSNPKHSYTQQLLTVSQINE